MSSLVVFYLSFSKIQLFLVTQKLVGFTAIGLDFLGISLMEIPLDCNQNYTYTHTFVRSGKISFGARNQVNF
jgi:hypothetical protein